jgi:hypothetical protein
MIIPSEPWHISTEKRQLVARILHKSLKYTMNFEFFSTAEQFDNLL